MSSRRARQMDFLIAVSMLALPSAVCAADPGCRGPNFIVILADDLGYGDLGCYGSGRAETPQIDRMAREGLRFTDFHSNGPMCSPTRAALLTGRYQQRAGVESALGPNGSGGNGLDVDAVTIAQRLESAGYATGAVGKWHLGYRPELHPNHFGFHSFRGCLCGSIDYQSHVTRWGDSDWWNNGKLENEEGYATDLITDHSVRFIDAHRDRPFFLYVSYTAIHFPWMTPQEKAFHQPGEDNSGLRKLGRHQGDLSAVVRQMIESMDSGVGRIMNAVGGLGPDRPTLVFFTSDNGGYLNYGSAASGISSNGPLRGQKGSLYEGGHRVPAIAWWPGRIQPGGLTPATALTMDVMPTCLELAGLAAAETRAPSLDGVSLAPLLFEGRALPTRTLFWRHGKDYAARRGPWKLVIGRGKKPELYNLEEDLGEARDLAGTHSKIVQELRSALAAWEKEVSGKTADGSDSDPRIQ